MTLPITKVTRLQMLLAPIRVVVRIDFASGDYRTTSIDEYDMNLLQALVDKADREMLLYCLMHDLERILRYRSE